MPSSLTVIKDRKEKQDWTQFAFPPLWHYDVLRAPDYLRAANVRPEARVEEAVALVLERRQGDGCWPLDLRHKGTLHEELAGAVGEPNRWITLRALRVLDWYARGNQTQDSTPG